jgi:hypothetical protein
LELVETRPEGEGRVELTFKGGVKSIWKIEYERNDK